MRIGRTKVGDLFEMEVKELEVGEKQMDMRRLWFVGCTFPTAKS